MTKPCECSEFNPRCMRAGVPMEQLGVRFYEMCSGRCPPARPCPEGAGDKLRDRWDQHPAKEYTPTPSGLGDTIESALALLGITKEKIEKWLGRPCGCKERRDKLNRLGAWAKRLLVHKGTSV